MPDPNPPGRSNEPALSLADAAAHLGWSRRTLIRALVRHGIPMIGSGGGPGWRWPIWSYSKLWSEESIRYQL
jgi:hypothetical protein